MSAKTKSRLLVLAAVISLLFSLAPEAVFAQGAGPANSNQPGPMLVLSDIACVNGNVVAHFVVNKIPAGATVTKITIGGSLAGGTVSAVTYNGNGQNAQFTVTLKGTGASTYNVQASVVVNGQTISLHNAGNYTITACGAPPPPPMGTLKICKVLAAGTTAPAGTLFTFSVTGRSTPVSVAPGTCAELTNMAAGNYTVAETGPSGYTVSAITFLAGTGTTNVAGGSAVATVAANATTEVQFTNMRATGFIQICKRTTGGLTGTFSFTSPAFAGTQSITVVAGATQPVCAPLTQVTAGQIAITEATGTGFTLTGVTAGAPGNLVSLSGTTATVNVPAGTAAQQVLVTFTNAPPATGYIQICKETGGGLTGTFSFTSPAFAGTQSITVVAGATQPVCGPLTQVTAGRIAVTEATGAGFTLTGVRTTGPGTFVSLSGTTATLNVPAGTAAQQTQVIFRNAPAASG